MEKAVGSASIDYKTDWAQQGLLGRVKSVQFVGSDYVVQFTAEGKQIDGPAESTKFNGRVREDETCYCTFETYKFDKLGRVMSVYASDYSMEFKYEGNNYFPSELKSVYSEPGEELSEDIHKFVYDAKDFDAHGNWLSRLDNGEKQTRVIVYY